MSTLLLATATAALISVHGHRGARGEFPENTLPAFEAALQAGVDVLELDVLFTKDKQLVVGHDPVISPAICQMLDGTPLTQKFIVFHKTLAEVKQLDCGTLVNPKFKESKRIPGTTMPTLDEVFELVKKSSAPAAQKVQFNIETKFSDDNPEEESPSASEFTEALVKSIKNSGLSRDRFIIQSFVWDSLEETKKLEPQIKTSALFTIPTFGIWDRIDSLKPDILSPGHYRLSHSFVKKAHKKGYAVVPWTANDVKTWQRLVNWKVDGIISDYPTALIKFLQKP